MGKTRNLIALLLTLSLTALTACGRQEDVETEGEITAATEEQAVVVEEPAAPEPRELTVAPTEENVRLVSRTYEEDGVTWLQSETSGCNHASSCLAFLLCQFFSWVGAILNLHPPPTPFGVSQDSPKGFRINFTSGSAISISSASG